jgi:hypothetical protein
MTGAALPLPEDYGHVLDDLAGRVRTSRAAAHRAVNAEMLALYRRIGRTLLDRERQDGWSPAELDRLAADLQAAFPQMTGLSRSNLRDMRAFALAWPDPAAAPHLDELPWGHIRVLLTEVTDPQTRDWYAAATVRYGWSRDVLRNQIMARAHLRAQV